MEIEYKMEENNKEVLNAIKEGNARFNSKKKEENLKAVPEKFAGNYSKAMDYEDDCRYDKARDICKWILNDEEGKDIEAVKIMLARVYPKVLETDIQDSNRKYQEDVSEYFEFLDNITMNDLMQEYIVETLARFCNLMDNEWYCPLFNEFVKTIDSKGYLSEEYRDVLDSAYASYESTEYFEDGHLGIIMKNVLKSGYERRYVVDSIKSEDKKRKMEIEINTSFYNLCQYLNEHSEETEYIKEEYPYSYKTIEDDIKLIKEDKSRYEEDILTQLEKYTAKDIDREALREAMYKAYEYMINSRPKPTVVHSGKTTYYRDGRKVGRNDLCPCGSGKKYKQCCGKDI